jgi:hypothetical protein
VLVKLRIDRTLVKATRRVSTNPYKGNIGHRNCSKTFFGDVQFATLCIPPWVASMSDPPARIVLTKGNIMLQAFLIMGAIALVPSLALVAFSEVADWFLIGRHSN